MHGDHFLEAPHLREKWGAPIWALDRMVKTMEHRSILTMLRQFRLTERKVQRLASDRSARGPRLQIGETFEWEGYRFTVDWMPGQTEFALCLHGMIDGARSLSLRQYLWRSRRRRANRPRSGGRAQQRDTGGRLHLRRRIFEATQADLLVGGHSFVMDRPAKFIERFRRWSYEMRDAFRASARKKNIAIGLIPSGCEPNRIESICRRAPPKSC